jgi:hypothetical protein
MTTTLRHVELALYKEETAIIGTSRKATLFVSYQESFLSNLQRWLTEWRIVINVSKSSAIIIAITGRHHSAPVNDHFGHPIKWVDTTRYLGVTLDKRLNWSDLIEKVSRRTAQSMGLMCPFLSRRSYLSIQERSPAIHIGYQTPDGLIVPRLEVSCQHTLQSCRS